MEKMTKKYNNEHLVSLVKQFFVLNDNNNFIVWYNLYNVK